MTRAPDCVSEAWIQHEDTKTRRRTKTHEDGVVVVDGGCRRLKMQGALNCGYPAGFSTQRRGDA